jgi:hypothetical protein
MKYPTIYDCCVIELPKIHFRAGNITPIEGKLNIPFEVARVFYIYDIPGGESRGAHAHIDCHQLLVAASGSFEVMMDDGRNKKYVMLNRPYFGLYIPPAIWSAEMNFSSGAICLTLASHNFNELDYIRDYERFKAFRTGMLDPDASNMVKEQ